MKYKSGMKVRLEDQVFEVIDECDNCKEGWETMQRDSGIEVQQICQQCDGLVDGSTTYISKKKIYIIIKEKTMAKKQKIVMLEKIYNS